MKISKETAYDKISAAMGLLVGHGKAHSFNAVANATKIKERTIRSYVDGTTPPVENLLSICAALGPGFTSDVLGLIGQSAQSSADECPQHMPTLCAATAFSSLLADALTDGHVDHREAAVLRPIAQSLMDLLAPIAEGRKPSGGAA